MSKKDSTCPNIKVVFVGDMFVGKTSIANAFISKAPFREHYSATIAGHFMARTLEDPHVTLQLWDTAGMERFRCMLPHFMRDAVGAIMVYDVTNRDTFKSIEDYWLDYVAASATVDNLVRVLVGNKVDREEDRVVKASEGRYLAGENGMIFLETSAKNRLNIDNVFIETAKEVIKKQASTTERDHGISLEMPQRSSFFSNCRC